MLVGGDVVARIMPVPIETRERAFQAAQAEPPIWCAPAGGDLVLSETAEAR